MRVAVLAGGASLEREVSLRSGHQVHGALTARSHEAIVLDPA
jgi:D-alanine-D-alanine ligase-like ATP-grasp enzyme